MARSRSQAPTQRQLRVNEEIRHALAWIIERGEFRDPLLAATPITITEVRCSPDLRNATVFFTPLGGGDSAGVRAALTRAKAYLRHELSRMMEMKYLPNLSFQPDTSFDEYARIDTLLHQPVVRRDTGAEPRLTDPDFAASLEDEEAGDEPEDGVEDGVEDGAPSDLSTHEGDDDA